MSSLLDKEEEDDFYKTTYGGFSEEADDRDFNYQSPQEEDDEVDSDFSIDENDDPKSDLEEDEEPRRKVRRTGAGVQTKAYKEPARRTDAKPSKPAAPRPSRTAGSAASSAAKSMLMRTTSPDYGGRRLTMRASTAQKTSEIIRTLKQRDAEARRRKMKMKKQHKVERKLTQEEILAEAKITERLNLASLKKYEEMELEAKRKAMRSGKREIKGPVIRHHSVSMPDTTERKTENLDMKPELETDDAEDDDREEKEEKEDTKPKLVSSHRQERTLVSFTHTETLRANFPRARLKVPSVKICPVTRLPAKYFDPVTELPYANLQAFKIIREAYYQQLEAKGDRTDPEVASWLEWRAKNKPAKPILAVINRPPASFASLAAGINRSVTGNKAVQQQHNQQHQQQQQQAQQQQQQVSSGVTATASPKQPVVLTSRPYITTTLSNSNSSSSAGITNSGISSSGGGSTASPVSVQTVRTGNQLQVTSGRTIATTTLTAAQLQQLAAARGQVFSALHSQLKQTSGNTAAAGSAGTAGGSASFSMTGGSGTGGAVRQVAVSQIGGVARSGQIISGQALVRGQTGLIVSQQPRAQTVTVQRPQVGLVAAGRAVKQQQVVVAASGSPTLQAGRAAPQQLVVAAAAGGQRPRPGQVVVVSTANPTRQHYVISSSQSGSPAQLVALTGGQTVRQGQYVTVAGQAGQHQIVVSQGGQIVLQPPTSKQL